MNTEKALSLCNRALVDLGEHPISSFDDGTDIAVVAKTRYDSVARDMLNAAAWSFATVQRQLPRIATAPLIDWTYAYQMPSEPPYIRMVRFSESGMLGNTDASEFLVVPGWRNSRVRYEIKTHEFPGDERRLVLMTDFTEAWIEYVGRIDEHLWPPSFDECVTIAMRKAFALAVTNNDDRAVLAHEELYGTARKIGALGRAMFHNVLEQSTRGLRDDAGLLSGR